MQQCTIILLPCGVAMEIRNLARIMKKQNGWSDVFYRIWVGVLCYQFHLHLPTHTNLKFAKQWRDLGNTLECNRFHLTGHRTLDKKHERARKKEGEKGLWFYPLEIGGAVPFLYIHCLYIPIKCLSWRQDVVLSGGDRSNIPFAARPTSSSFQSVPFRSLDLGFFDLDLVYPENLGSMTPFQSW